MRDRKRKRKRERGREREGERERERERGKVMSLRSRNPASLRLFVKSSTFINWKCLKYFEMELTLASKGESH